MLTCLGARVLSFDKKGESVSNIIAIDEHSTIDVKCQTECSGLKFLPKFEKSNIIRDDFGNKISFSRDNNNDLLTIVDSYGNETKCYKNSNELVITNAKDQSYIIKYDEAGNIVSTLDEKGIATYFSYDEYGHFADLEGLAS